MERYNEKVVVLALGLTGGAAAQDGPVPMPLAKALKNLPDPESFTIEVSSNLLPQAQLRGIVGQVGMDAMDNHFYGAIYAYIPAETGMMEIKVAGACTLATLQRPARSPIARKPGAPEMANVAC